MSTSVLFVEISVQRRAKRTLQKNKLFTILEAKQNYPTSINNTTKSQHNNPLIATTEQTPTEQFHHARGSHRESEEQNFPG